MEQLTLSEKNGKLTDDLSFLWQHVWEMLPL